MKTQHAWILYTALAGFAASVGAAIQKEAQEPQVVERGSYYRKWLYVVTTIEPDGRTVVTTNRYTEVATGLHYWKDGQWVESREVIDIVPGGALASQGPYQVGFAANINTVGAIDMVTTDGQRLRSHVLGLAYLDARTGQSVMIAEVKDSIGMLVRENQIIYGDAFDEANGVRADIRYTYTMAGLEQDIILLDNPIGPEAYGLDPATTRLEVYTEFIEAPEPIVTDTMVLASVEPDQRAGMVLPDFINENLSFGAMRMTGAQAFPLSEESDPQRTIPTGKTWEKRDGRTFLIEAVQYPEVKRQLGELHAEAKLKREARAIPKVKPGRTFPVRSVRAPKATEAVRMAVLFKRENGFVIDYNITSGVTNFTFAADTTYFVGGGNFILWGTNTILEGGTVVKYTNATLGSQLRFVDGLVCQTSPYRPAIATSMHDDTVGATMGGSTGNPTDFCGFMFYLGSGSASYFNLHDIHVSHAYRAFFGFTGVSADISNCQVRHAHGAFNNNTAFWNLRNILVSDVLNAFTGGWPHTNNAEQITFFSVSNFVVSVVPALPAVRLTNSILIGVTNGVLYVGSGVQTNISGTGVFQTVGSGSFYLATNSPYRDAGTTNINPTLQSDLRQRTTYPPQVLSNSVVTDVTLSRLVPRDTDTPDLGYHYDALDYFASQLMVSNATVILTNGAALGLDYSAGSWGILLNNSKFISEGSPTNVNHLVRAHMVQERSSGNPGVRALFYDGDSPGASNELRLRFTFFAQLPVDGYMLYTGQKFSALEWTHSAIYNPSLVVDTAGGNYLTCGVTNSLWERGGGEFGLTSSSANTTVHARNNLFKNFAQAFVGGNSGWTVNDNLVDGGGLDDQGVAIANVCNAYYLAVTSLSGGTSNLTLTNLTYVTGPLGNYYQPTNSSLINRGSITANQVALYHFTTSTNQAKETNSVVDIGLHYVATDSGGIPLDLDGDGIPDYLEDRNGNGIYDASGAGETDWQIYNSANGLSNSPSLKVFTPLK